MAENVFITGASTGIGKHLAYGYARRGAFLGLASRRTDLLESVADHCRELGGKAEVYPLDVTDQEACAQAAEHFLESRGTVTMVIANAGVGGKDDLSSGNASRINRILATNILGVTNSVVPFIPAMKKQQAGTIVIVGSVAGFRGLVAHGGYSGSKSAIKTMADGWRYSLSRSNIQVTTICPGFIDTSMTRSNNHYMPFLMDVDVAADKIITAVKRERKTYVFPWQWNLVIPILKILPFWVIQRLTN